MNLALEGITYFQTYYQNLLLFAVSISMIGWIFFLYQQLNIDIASPATDQKTYNSKKSIRNYVVVSAVISLFVYGKFLRILFWEIFSTNQTVSLVFSAQNLSIANGVFLIFPVICWYPVKTFNMLRQLTKFETWFWIAGIELLVSR